MNKADELLNNEDEYVFMLEDDDLETYLPYRYFINEELLITLKNELMFNDTINEDIVYDSLTKFLLNYLNNDTLIDLDTNTIRDYFYKKYEILLNDGFIICFYKIINNFFRSQIIQLLQNPYVMIKTITYENDGLNLVYRLLREDEV